MCVGGGGIDLGILIGVTSPEHVRHCVWRWQVSLRFESLHVSVVPGSHDSLRLLHATGRATLLCCCHQPVSALSVARLAAIVVVHLTCHPSSVHLTQHAGRLMIIPVLSSGFCVGVDLSILRAFSPVDSSCF